MAVLTWKCWGLHFGCSDMEVLGTAFWLFSCGSVMDCTLAVLMWKCWGQHFGCSHVEVLWTALWLFSCGSIGDSTCAQIPPLLDILRGACFFVGWSGPCLSVADSYNNTNCCSMCGLFSCEHLIYTFLLLFFLRKFFFLLLEF